MEFKKTAYVLHNMSFIMGEWLTATQTMPQLAGGVSPCTRKCSVVCMYRLLGLMILTAAAAAATAAMCMYTDP